MAYVNNPGAAAFVPASAQPASATPTSMATPQPQPQQAAAAAAISHGAASAGNSLALLNMSNLINQKDSRWLQLEVCREFQRNKCSRSDNECKFAHPTSNVEVQNGRVTACYDSIKGRCNREKPPCKYFHPPQHLKDQLLINGRNHLALKNALMQQMGYMSQPFLAGQFPSIQNSGYVAFPHATPGYIPSPLQSPYLTSPLAHINPAMMSLFPTAVTSPTAAAVGVAGANGGGAVVSTEPQQQQLQDSSRQMQAALLTPMSVPNQFQQHPQIQQQIQAQTHQHKKDRVEGVPADRNM